MLAFVTVVIVCCHREAIVKVKVEQSSRVTSRKHYLFLIFSSIVNDYDVGCRGVKYLEAL